MTKFEHWPAGGRDSYLYTEVFIAAKEIRKDFPDYSIYFRNGYLFAWQFRIPKRVLALLINKVGTGDKNLTAMPAERNATKPDVETKELTDV